MNSSVGVAVGAGRARGVDGPLGLMEFLVGRVGASDGSGADPIGPCIDATLTVTLGAPKLPLVLPPGEAHCGDVVIADIGIPEAAIEAVEGPHIELLTREPMRALIEPRPADSHKGDYGHVLIVAGSPGKTGAAHLSSMGALKSGAGLVTIATPRSCQAVLAAMAPEYMTVGLDESPDGIAPDALEHVLAHPADVIAAGPGLGTGRGTVAFVHGLLDRAGVPLVLDADALNAFVGEPDQLVGPEGRDVIITPHPGELARLMGVTSADVQANRVELAQNFAESHQLYVVLKGHRSIVATPEGHVFVNPTGNPGMATGGMGDVLTGMIAAWLAQLLDAEAACRLAVYLHGMAGDLAESAEGRSRLDAERPGRAHRRRDSRADGAQAVERSNGPGVAQCRVGRLRRIASDLRRLECDSRSRVDERAPGWRARQPFGPLDGHDRRVVEQVVERQVGDFGGERR